MAAVYPPPPQYGGPSDANPYASPGSGAPNPYASPGSGAPNPYANPGAPSPYGYAPPPPYQDPYAAQYPQAPPPQQAAPAQQYYPPAPDYTADDPNIQVSYNYDPYHVQYQPIEITSWQNQQCDQSNYSKFWDSPDQFVPEKFIENMKASHRCNDVFWVILFLLNLAGTIAVCALTWPKVLKGDYDTTSVLSTFDRKILWLSIGIGVAISVGLNLIHYVFVTCAPLCYIRVGFFLGTVVSIACTIWAMLKYSYAFVIFPIISILFTLIMYCVCRQYFKLSAAVINQAAKLVCKFPSILFLCLLDSIFSIAINFLYALSFYAIEYLAWSRWLYLYMLFSYFWVSLTIGYVVYVTIAGLAADWYFLNDTNYFPRFPLCSSFKRAITTSFGSCCIAGLLLAIVQTLKAIVRMPSNGGGCVGAIIAILKCIAMCILAILECFLKWLNRYALIYCAIYGVPYMEGCRRWAELSCHRFVEVLMGGVVISNVLSFNEVMFSIGGAILGFGIGWALGETTDEKLWMALLTCIMGLLFTFGVFDILCEPILVVSDTLLVCFAESPENLRTTASELYDKLSKYYGKKLSKLSSAKENDQPRRRDSSS